MPITGSQKALMQARSGIARAGATRSGYFTPNVVVYVNGVDRTTSVASVSLSLAWNDEPDTARIVFDPTAGLYPTNGQEVIVGLGTVANREFAGQITEVSHVRTPDRIDKPWVELICVDWLRLFNRRLVTREWRTMTATAIAKDIVDSYTSGFTRNHVHPELGTIEYFSATNELPSTVMRRLGHIAGGGFYVDAFKDVHLFGSAGPYRPETPPLTLQNVRPGLRKFSQRHDINQLRTRVVVEGQRTSVPTIAVPAGSTTFPVDDDTAFNESTTPPNGGGITYTRRARIGTQPITYTTVSELNLIPGVSYPGTNVTTDAAIGATSLEIDSLPPDAPVWAKVGEQVIFALDFDTGPNRLIQIPASGYGSIQAAVEAGTEVSWLPYLIGIPVSGAGSIQVTQPAGTDVVMVLEVNDTAAQTAMAAIEGGDGIHEHLVQDHRLTVEGAQSRALAELAAFKSPLTMASPWETEDFNAKPGRAQAIAFTGSDPLSTTLTIMRTDINWPAIKQGVKPTRVCEASNVKLAEREDFLVSAEN